MKLSILAKRQHEAHKRLVTAVANLAEALGLAQPELNPRVKQPQVARLERDERLGAFLETAVSALNQQVTAVLEQAQGYLSKDDILAIPGLTKTSREAIETYFADLETAETEDA